MAFRLHVCLAVFATLTLFVTFATAEVGCNVPNCLSCRRNDVNLCRKCVHGYKTSFEGCVKDECLIENCAKCNVKGACESCATGYKLNNGACDFICTDSRCTKCKNEDICTECTKGLVLQSGICMKPYCFQGICKVCSGFEDPDCKECPAGTTRTVKNWVCVKDAPEPEKCEKCSGEGACENCDESAHTKENEDAMEKCNLDNCQECNTKDSCKRCRDGYKLGASNNCLRNANSAALSSYTFFAGSVVVASAALFLV